MTPAGGLGLKEPRPPALLARMAIEVPRVHVVGAGAADMVRYVVARWKEVRPKEYAGWANHCFEQRKAQNDEGWTANRDLKQAFVIPSYIMLTLGQVFKDPGWMEHDEVALNAYLSELPCSRIDGKVGTPGHSAFTSADRQRSR